MRPGAILQAAVEIVSEIDKAKRPADRMLKDWGKSHRYAGSKDRAAIGEIVFGVYRHRRDLMERFSSDEPRLLVLGYHINFAKTSIDDLSALCTGTGYDAAPLTDAERSLLAVEASQNSPVEAPDWLLKEVMSGLDAGDVFGAMRERAPFDLRVDTLKSSRDEVLHLLAQEGVDGIAPTTLSPVGLRSEAPVNLQQNGVFKDGLVEVQDEGSQLVSLLLDAKAGESVIELCAGGGGKTLVLGATMLNQGHILACDTDLARLKEVKKRAVRAGVAIAQTQLIQDWDGAGEIDPDLAEKAGTADLVVIDAPCSGSGTWRRAPDAKWHLTPARLEELIAIQARILTRGARLVRPGGRLAYITCSLFERENTTQIDGFLAQNPEFLQRPVQETAERVLGGASGLHDRVYEGDTLLLAPHVTGTDGFFLTIMQRKA